MKTRQLPLLNLLLLTAWALPLAGAREAVRAPVKPVPPAQNYETGRSYLIGGNWFQYLGPSAVGTGAWLYPHLDGVREVFRERAEAPGTWEGDLESSYDPARGTFSHLFNAAAVLCEFLEPGATKETRAQTARLLRLYCELHASGGPPYYLRSHLQALDRILDEDARRWVQAAKDAHQAALAKVEPGTVLPGLATPSSQRLDPSDYYRRMLQDGYLDLAIVGGNSYDPERCVFLSGQSAEDLRVKLEKMGFLRHAFRNLQDRTLATKTVRMLGQSITVRVHCTGGSSRDERILRGVANFVEGLAQADLFVYHGHSNLWTGNYYVGETISEFSRFRIGLDDQTDLAEKCFGLKQKAYQIVAFQSCSSYEKYSRPIRGYFEEQLRGQAGCAGFMGTSAYCYFVDFVPRYSALFEMLLQEKGARDICLKLNSIRPNPNTPHQVLRGILQPRFSFIVPAGVTVGKFQESRADGGNLVCGTGSDGKKYWSSEVFAQNRPGEIVQVVALGETAFGLTEDGRLFEAGARLGGAMGEAPLLRATSLHGVFISKMEDMKRETLLLLASDGKWYLRDPAAERLYLAPIQPPAGVRMVAAGTDRQGRLAAQDAQGRAYVWQAGKGRWEILDASPEYADLSPSLLGYGIPGVLWTPEGTRP